MNNCLGDLTNVEALKLQLSSIRLFYFVVFVCWLMNCKGNRTIAAEENCPPVRVRAWVRVRVWNRGGGHFSSRTIVLEQIVK